MCHEPTIEEVCALGAEQDILHGRAAAVAREIFGGNVFVRAVVEVSNFCRENCHYCGMRRDNRDLARFRASWEQIAELLIHHRPQSVTDVNIQSGEDPRAVSEIVIPLIRALRRETTLGISVCLGTLPHEVYSGLRKAGAVGYILKFETAHAGAYATFQSPGTLQERLAHIHQLASSNWRVSSGFIAGLPGQTASQLVEALQLASRLPLRGASVSPFIPGDQTPLAAAPAGNADQTLNCMALLRLMNPDWAIPAVSALGLTDRKDAYVRGLLAGANLATINITPGPLQRDYVLYRRDRMIMTEQRVLDAISAAGLQPSTTSMEEHYAVVGAGSHHRCQTTLTT